MNTRRYPRTLSEAFGPYTSTQIEDPDKRRFARQDRIVVRFCCAVVLVLVGMVVGGVL